MEVITWKSCYSSDFVIIPNPSAAFHSLCCRSGKKRQAEQRGSKFRHPVFKTRIGKRSYFAGGSKHGAKFSQDSMLSSSTTGNS